MRDDLGSSKQYMQDDQHQHYLPNLGNFVYATSTRHAMT
jgi:hypothetical protein